MTTFADLDNIWNWNQDTDETGYPVLCKEVQTLCDNAKPADFYVDVHQHYDGTGCFISVVPVEYYKSCLHMFDQTLPIDHLLPEDFSEAMESIYECDRDAEPVRQDLLERGFQENKEFSELCNESMD